ncbi:hypothetical protein ACFY5D_16610 [Paeniglutamicibacter sp. NPDC012692]|uniref:phage holin n=1 Tax=Paeniglutamicibacter sp. NPDC012692 TaxID=3364388 RepID=UPI0036CDDCEA
MNELFNKLKEPKTRKWIYGIATAAIPLLIGYGALTAATGGLWLVLVGAILGVGTNSLASANTKPEAQPLEESPESDQEELGP